MHIFWLGNRTIPNQGAHIGGVVNAAERLKNWFDAADWLQESQLIQEAHAKITIRVKSNDFHDSC